MPRAVLVTAAVVLVAAAGGLYQLLNARTGHSAINRPSRRRLGGRGHRLRLDADIQGNLSHRRVK